MPKAWVISETTHQHPSAVAFGEGWPFSRAAFKNHAFEYFRCKSVSTKHLKASRIPMHLTSLPKQTGLPLHFRSSIGRAVGTVTVMAL